MVVVALDVQAKLRGKSRPVRSVIQVKPLFAP